MEYLYNVLLEYNIIVNNILWYIIIINSIMIDHYDDKQYYILLN